MSSSSSRATGVLLAVLGAGLSCLVLGVVPDATCCSDASCQAMLDAGCCDSSSSIPSAPAGTTPSLIAERIQYVVFPRWAEISRLASARCESGVAFGIRTTVLRL